MSDNHVLPLSSQLYRETDKRGPTTGSSSNSSEPSSLLVTERDQYSTDPPANRSEPQSLSRPKGEASSTNGMDRNRERILLGSLTNNYKFKPDGMMKKASTAFQHEGDNHADEVTLDVFTYDSRHYPPLDFVL